MTWDNGAGQEEIPILSTELERWDPRNPVVIAWQEEQVIDLRKAGHSIREVAEVLHISKSTVQRRQDAALSRIPVNDREELRKLEVLRLDRYLAALDTRVQTGDAQAIQAALRVADRRAKLLGLDAPTVVEATVTQTTQQDMELAEMIRDAQARVALEENALRGRIGNR